MIPRLVHCVSAFSKLSVEHKNSISKLKPAIKVISYHEHNNREELISKRILEVDCQKQHSMDLNLCY